MNLFLITSPFQLICAIEAKHHFQTQDNILIIREEKTASSKKQMRLLLRKNEWAHIIKLGRRSKVWEALKLQLQLKMLKADLRFDAIFYADYSAWRTAVLLNNIHVQKEIMIDDGVGTIREYKNKIEPNLHVSHNKKSRDFLLKLVGLQSPREIYPRRYFSFFTFFELPQSRYPVETNTFSLLKQRLGYESCYAEHTKVGFIGQGMVAVIGINLDDYCAILQKLLDKHPQGLIYFPHRSEADFVKERVMQMEGIEYHQPNLPLELELAVEKMQLSAIYGIASTANVTLKNIYPEIPVYDIRVPIESYVNKDFGDSFHMVADYLDFKTIDIKL